jgi:hypothetical protein
VRAGYIPKEKANDLGIICSVWLSPGVIQAESVDHFSVTLTLETHSVTGRTMMSVFRSAKTRLWPTT